MIRHRRMQHLAAMLLGLAAAVSAAAQSVTIGGEDVDVFFAVASGEKKVKVIQAAVSPGGQVAIPAGVASGLKQHTPVRTYYRRNKCTHRKEVLIAPADMTAEQIAAEEKKNGQDCGGWILLPGGESTWEAGKTIAIDYSGEAPTETASGTPAGGTRSTTGGRIAGGNIGQFEIEILPGAQRVNGNNGMVVNAGGSFLLNLGNTFEVGPSVSGGGGQTTTTFAVPFMPGGGSMGATFLTRRVRPVGAQVGGALNARIQRIATVGLVGGLEAANLHVHTVSGFCVTTCTVVSDTNHTAFAPGYYAGAGGSVHVVGPVGVVFLYEYERPGTLSRVNIHYNSFYGGVRFTFAVGKGS